MSDLIILRGAGREAWQKRRIVVAVHGGGLKEKRNNDQKLCCPIPSDLRRKLVADLFILYKWYILGNFTSLPLLLLRFEGG